MILVEDPFSRGCAKDELSVFKGEDLKIVAARRNKLNLEGEHDGVY
jgi:hypothetical protein